MADPRAFGPHVPVYREVGSAPGGSDWLTGLPAVVDQLEREWAVSTGAPFLEGFGAWTAPAVTADGVDAVLKVSWPHREARGEATALALWDGDGAVRLLRSDAERQALLLERCRPGVALAASDGSEEMRLRIGATLLRRLWSHPVPAGTPLERMGAVCTEWATMVEERAERLDHRLDRGMIALAADLLRSLPASADRDVVVHGDCNPGNILSASREPWLAIDPKPMIGDPAYDLWPLLTQVGAPFSASDPASVLAERGRLTADVAGVAAERVLAWSTARAVESALWRGERGDAAGAAREMAEASVLTRAAGL